MHDSRSRPSRLSHAIRQANAEGRLGLIVYVVPGYPDRVSAERLLHELEARAFVTIIEATVPVATSFETASPPIREAHARACANLGDDRSQGDVVRSNKPNFAVLYRETFDLLGIDGVLDTYGPFIDGVIPEWIPELAVGDAVNARATIDVEYVVALEPGMSDDDFEVVLAQARDDGMVYLACAPMTAGTMRATAAIDRCARRIRSARPAATIAAGMGIRGPQEIETLARSADIDAVVVGTAFIEAASRSTDEALDFLDALRPALERRRKERCRDDHALEIL